MFDGPETPARSFLHAVGAWATELHEEIYVFENGFWNKSHALWQEVQKANWDDVILKQSFKDTVRKDVNSFFDSEDLYKKLAIPWKVRVINPPAFIHLHGFLSVESSCMALQVCMRANERDIY